MTKEVVESYYCLNLYNTVEVWNIVERWAATPHILFHNLPSEIMEDWLHLGIGSFLCYI